MACGDVLSLEDLQTAKKHQIFEAEVITGKVGGVAGGTAIDYATNQVTGQVQKTMPAILRDLGFEPATFDFTTGGTLSTADRNKAVLWPLSSGGDGYWYYWEGALPKVIPAASTPASTGGVVEGAWRPVGDITLRDDLAANDGAALIGAATYAQVRAYDGTATKINCLGRTNIFDGASGIFSLDDVDTTSADNDCTTLVDALGRRWKRVYSGAVKAEWAGVYPGSAYVHAELQNLIANFNSAEFRAGSHKLNATITIENKSFKFFGQGARGTFFDFYNAGEHFVFRSIDGGFCDYAGLDNCCIRNITGAVATALTVTGRNGKPQPITNFCVENLAVNNYGQVGSKGFVINGIETSTFNRFYIQADMPIHSPDVINKGIDRSTFSNFYLNATGDQKAIVINSSVSDVVFENGICAQGTGALFYGPAASDPTHLTVRDVRFEQPIAKTNWAFDIQGGATLVVLDRVVAGNCNGVRANNCRSITVLDSWLGFNYTGTDQLLSYSFDNVGYARVENIVGGLNSNISVNSANMIPTKALTRTENPRVVYSGEWTRDTAIGTASYDTVNNVKTLKYKVAIPTGNLAHRLPVSSPIVGAVNVTAAFHSTASTSVEMVNATISEGGIATAGASTNSGAAGTPSAGKIILLYQAGAGIYVANNMGATYDAVITINLM